MPTIEEIITALKTQAVPAARTPTRQALEGELADMFRYTAGVPLVRHDRRHAWAWSFLCPVPTCQKMYAEFETAGVCRAAWFRHSDEPGHHGPDFTPAWPGNIEYEPVTQPVCWPGDFKDVDVLIELIGRGQGVDMAGRLLRYESCTVCPPESGYRQHKVISGATCVMQVPCIKCGVGAGTPCDRSTRELSPVEFGRAEMASAHSPRFLTAAADEDRRRDAGDLTLPAGWAQQPAPTKRRFKHRSGMSATLTVDEDRDNNEMWSGYVDEVARTGRVWTSKMGTRVHIAYPDRQTAQWAAQMLTRFYNVPAAGMRISDGVTDPRYGSSNYASMVEANAVSVLAACTKSTPVQHVAWAAGVLSANRAGNLARDVLTVDDFADICSGRSVGNGLSIRNERTGFTVHKGFGHGDPVQVLKWPRVIGLIQKHRSSATLAALREALTEVGSFPLYSVERERAVGWGIDVAMQAWMEVRPKDLPPLQPMTETEAALIPEQGLDKSQHAILASR